MSNQPTSECSEPAPVLKPGSKVLVSGQFGVVKFASEQTVTLRAAINGRRCFERDEVFPIHQVIDIEGVI